jgi:Ca2+-binding EF-hand superfamily protein
LLPTRHDNASFAFENSDGSGSIDRNEFLQIPQIANNPLASRMIAIFDEECVASLTTNPFSYPTPFPTLTPLYLPFG